MNAFDALCHRLENWTSIQGDGLPPYDDVGALHLLAALLRNLDAHAVALDDPEIVAEILGVRERAALLRIVAAIQER